MEVRGIVFFQILVRAGASNVMLVTLLIPVSALVLGNLFLDEPIEPKEIIGAAIIGIGLLFIDGRLVNRFMGRRASPHSRASLGVASASGNASSGTGASRSFASFRSRLTWSTELSTRASV